MVGNSQEALKLSSLNPCELRFKNNKYNSISHICQKPATARAWNVYTTSRRSLVHVPSSGVEEKGLIWGRRGSELLWLGLLVKERNYFLIKSWCPRYSLLAPSGGFSFFSTTLCAPGGWRFSSTDSLVPWPLAGSVKGAPQETGRLGASGLRPLSPYLPSGPWIGCGCSLLPQAQPWGQTCPTVYSSQILVTSLGLQVIGGNLSQCCWALGAPPYGTTLPGQEKPHLTCVNISSVTSQELLASFWGLPHSARGVSPGSTRKCENWPSKENEQGKAFLTLNFIYPFIYFGKTSGLISWTCWLKIGVIS